MYFSSEDEFEFGYKIPRHLIVYIYTGAVLVVFFLFQDLLASAWRLISNFLIVACCKWFSKMRGKVHLAPDASSMLLSDDIFQELNYGQLYT